jgi:hypothetical protein
MRDFEMKKINLDDMKAHIERLVARLNADNSPDDMVEVQWIENDEGGLISRADGGKGRVRFIQLPTIRSEINYVTALHEFGHVHGRYQRSREIVRERWAWQWARDNALAWTPAMEREAKKCLQTYDERISRADDRRATEIRRLLGWPTLS